MFYEFTQNNSGGSFVADARVGYAVIIEASNLKEANSRAEDVGIYFNGCEDGLDCPCCGDRWHPAYGKGDKVPSHYGKPVEKTDDSFWGLWLVIHYKNGDRRYVTKGGKVHKTLTAAKKAIRK